MDKICVHFDDCVEKWHPSNENDLHIERTKREEEKKWNGNHIDIDIDTHFYFSLQ